MDNSLVCAVVIGLSVAACSGGDDDTGGGPGGGGGGAGGSTATGGAGGLAGSAGQAGATGGASGQAGAGGAAGVAGSADQSGGAGAGGSAGGKLYPLHEGAAWTYQVQAVGGGAVCAPGVHASEVVGPKSVGGKDGFEVTSWCSAVAGTDVFAPGDGDEVFLYYSGKWLTVIDPNVVEGHTWSYFNTSYTWRSEGNVTVPAGTFDDCWSAVQNVAYTAYTTYCRGIGPVRSYSSDLSGSGWDAQLSAVSAAASD